MIEERQGLEPVVRVVSVPARPAAAFRRFTAEMATWWPLATHSVGGDRAETVTVEGRVGGRIVERTRAGEEHVWGTLSAWDPPRRVVFSWHPGHPESTAQEVEVRFEEDPDDPGRTRVTLEHRGWEALGDEAESTRATYVPGWAMVLDLYATA